MATICVYGDFKNKDIRVKVVSDQEQFRFQNILRSAGYDAELFLIKDDEIKGKENK